MANNIIQCFFPPGAPRSAQSAIQCYANGSARLAPKSLANVGRGVGQCLPDGVRHKMEGAFNTSFADVRIHVGPEAGSVGALAFTCGSHLYFAPGQYDPLSRRGQELLGHELAHVVQQRAGRVRNPFMSGVAVVEDRALEAEADRMGRAAAAGLAVVASATGRTAATSGTMQLKGGPRWTAGQRANRKAAMDAEHMLLLSERASTTEIVASDEAFFQEYLAKFKKPARVYRGDGRGVNAAALNHYVRQPVNPKPGAPDISFYGVLDHTHSNSSPGGMVSTTSDRQIAQDWAMDKHNYGLVYEFYIWEYIDVNWLLAARNFRNRYYGQHEYLIPRGLKASEMKSVTLYHKDKHDNISQLAWLAWP